MIEEGKKETFFGHGLWAVRDTKFIYADILDLGFETEPEWPIDVKNRFQLEDFGDSGTTQIINRTKK